MYKKFYGLNSNPFSVSPDPRFIYMMDQTREALACLSFGIHNRKGFIQLTGEVGTGKTTILNHLLGWLQQRRVASAFVFNPRLDVNEFLAYVLRDFGVPCESSQKGEMLTALNSWLLERQATGELACLIIREAHALSAALLAARRLLTNPETPQAKLLQIIPCRQPELET